MFADLRLLLNTRSRKETLLALTAAYMLVQLSSLPVAISLPTLSRRVQHRNRRYGVGSDYLPYDVGRVCAARREAGRPLRARPRLFHWDSSFDHRFRLHRDIPGTVAHLGVARGGRAGFRPGDGQRQRDSCRQLWAQRARSRIRRAYHWRALRHFDWACHFGVLLQFVGWRMVFVTFVPIGVLATVASIPMVRSQARVKSERDDGPIDCSAAFCSWRRVWSWFCRGRTCTAGRSLTPAQTRLPTICRCTCCS